MIEGRLELLELRFEQAAEDPVQQRIAMTLIQQISAVDPSSFSRWGWRGAIILPRANLWDGEVFKYTLLGGVSVRILGDGEIFGLKITLSPSGFYRVSFCAARPAPDGHIEVIDKDTEDEITWQNLVPTIDRLIGRNRP